MGEWVDGSKKSCKIHVLDVNRFELKQSRIGCIDGVASCALINAKLENSFQTSDCYGQNGFESVNCSSDDLISLTSECRH